MITSDLRFGSYVRPCPNSITLQDIAPAPTPAVPAHEAAATTTATATATATATVTTTTPAINDGDELRCAIGEAWTALLLLDVVPYNKDTSLLRFALPPGKARLHLPVGAFLLIQHGEVVRPYTSVSSDDDEMPGTFQILVKRYDEWGQRECLTTHFLFTKTDHSYKPPGVMSNYLHGLRPGTDVAHFSFSRRCVGSLGQCLKRPGLKTVTLIAVGVGVAPMVHALRSLLSDVGGGGSMKVVLLYGVRNVCDILMREQLEAWRQQHAECFSVVYCVGSRWANVHMGIKTKDAHAPPPLPDGFAEVADHAEVGWVSEDRIRTHGFPPADDTLIVVCGLPGVYAKLCGRRSEAGLADGCALKNLGYSDHMVCKL